MQPQNTGMNFPGRNSEENLRSEVNKESSGLETTTGDLQDDIIGEPVMDEEDMEENDLTDEDLDDIEWEEPEGENGNDSGR
jgi:hypothetical protein